MFRRAGPAADSRRRSRPSATAAATLRQHLAQHRRRTGATGITRSCARRSLAAETIFMALVICCVFLTERMRRRMSIRLGMCRLPLASGSATKRALNSSIDGLHLAAQLVVQAPSWCGFRSHSARCALSMKR